MQIGESLKRLFEDGTRGGGGEGPLKISTRVPVIKLVPMC